MTTPNLSLQHKSSETTGKGHERAHDILLTARTLFATEGYAGFSMRTLAARAGITLSSLQHYYASKDILLAALLDFTRESYQAGIDQRLAALADKSRIEQFEAVIDYLLDDISDPISNGLMFELWALANRHQAASAILDKLLSRARKTLRNLIRGLSANITPAQSEIRATLILAQIEGLTLFLAENRRRPEELAELRTEARALLMRLAVEEK